MKQIKTLPPSFRPREKILKLGAQALSEAELLALILVTGNKDTPVSKFSSQIAKIISHDKNLTKDQLLSLGLGPTKTAQILAALELGKRLSNTKPLTLTSAEQVFAQSFEIIHQDKESLLCFYLNARGEMLTKEILAIGAINRVNILPREIFSLIKDLPIAAVILVHNHPSGNLDPSKDDILFSKRVKKAADILGIKLLDHLIVSSQGWKRIKF